MTDVVRRIVWPGRDTGDGSRANTREWLVTNGLGGYASGTVSTLMTRRYHGLLIAALPAPLGRTYMLSHLDERLYLPDGKVVATAVGWEASGDGKPAEMADLAEFRLEMGLPVWRYEVGELVLEKRLLLPYRQNTVHVSYRLVAGPGSIRLEVRPSVHFRPHEQPVNTPLSDPYALTVVNDRYELQGPAALPRLRFRMHGPAATFRVACETIRQVLYPLERSRGYESTGDLWSPGYFRITFDSQAPVTLVASTEPWEAMDALDPETALRTELARRRRLHAVADPRARTGPAAELVLAADQFVIAPAGRVADTALIRATGDEARTIIAGYHWFTDWGRDTMIALEGLTLVTGRHVEAGYILRTFAHYVRDGLIPNMFPEGTRQGLYHTADATLWYFHAIDRYVRATGDRETLRLLLPTLVEIVEHHVRGTRFGIGVDPTDGLIRQGAAGYQLTWMDAKVDDWVVTPRRGKPVEINALWHNALCLLEGWVREERGDGAARSLAARAEGARGVQRALLVRRGRLPLRRDRRRGGRRHGLPAESAPRDLARASRARPDAVAIRPRRGPRAARHAGGAPDPRAGPPGLPGDVRRRPPGSRRRLSSGHGLALAARALRRRMAPRLPRGPRGHPPAPARLRGAPRRGLRRQHQRDLRRRSPVHAPRLHRPGLERGRGAPRPYPHERAGRASWEGGHRGARPRPTSGREGHMTHTTARVLGAVFLLGCWRCWNS